MHASHRRRNKLLNINEIKYSQSVIDEKRKEVRLRLIDTSENIKSGVITKMSPYDIKLLFDLYDEVFFNGLIKEGFKGKIKFSLSTRMTRSAGKTMFLKNLKRMKMEAADFEIRMGTNFFLKYYATDGDKSVNGIRTNDSLEALQLVFEHELCHFLEAIEFKKTSCSGIRFKIIAHNIFGHRDVYHALPTSREIAGAKYGIKIGDKVSFTFKGRSYEGFISSINKRAAVMVRDSKGSYVDRKGNRYMKYYVPIEGLRME